MTQTSDLSRPLVVFHASCFDGFCAAWVIKNFSPPHENAEFVEAFHDAFDDELLEKARDRDVVMVDVCPKRNRIQDFHRAAKSLLVLDHHKTAEAECHGLDYCIFDMTHSGAMLAWIHLAVDVDGTPVKELEDWAEGNRPWVVDYVEDADLYKWELPNSREYTAGLRSYPRTFESWAELHIEDIHTDDLVVEGKAVLRAQRRDLESCMKRWHYIELGGHIVPAVNMITHVSSGNEVAASLVRMDIQPPPPFGVVYAFDGEMWNMSLRSMDEREDVGEVARKFGGGGHRNAAALRVKTPPLKYEAYVVEESA